MFLLVFKLATRIAKSKETIYNKAYTINANYKQDNQLLRKHPLCILLPSTTHFQLNFVLILNYLLIFN